MRRLLAPLCLALASCLVSPGPAGAATSHVERLSDGPNGLQGNDYSYSPAVSADGRYVAFESFADNLDPITSPSTASMDVFVRDRVTGVTRQVSVDSSGNPGDSYSANADISEDGRYVVFDSHSRMDPRHTNLGHNVYRRDLVTRTTEIVSVNDGGQTRTPTTTRTWATRRSPRTAAGWPGPTKRRTSSRTTPTATTGPA
jgi:Tol biopolymer transport system component